MAIPMTPELRDALRTASGVDEIVSMLKADGHEVTEEDVARIKVEIYGADLSLDELDAVGGGYAADYNYLDDGCSATVEYGSDCFTNDGGCSYVYNSYSVGPTAYKCTCGRNMARLRKDTDPESLPLNGHLKCPFCGRVVNIQGDLYDALAESH